MNNHNFPWGLYAPGLTLIGIGILALILPKFLVAVIVTLLFVAGGVALLWARKIHKSLDQANTEFEWNTFRFPW